MTCGRVRLLLVWCSQPGSWVISGTPAEVHRRADGSWALRGRLDTDAHAGWVDHHQLSRERFPTRAAACRRVRAQFAADPAPVVELPPARVIRTAENWQTPDGQYRICACPDPHYRWQLQHQTAGRYRQLLIAPTRTAAQIEITRQRRLHPYHRR